MVHKYRNHLFEIVLVVSFSLLALILCINAIYGVRPGTHHDEITTLNTVNRILTEGRIGFFVLDNTGMGTITHYSAIPFVLIGGVTLDMLRLSHAIFYVAMIPVTYALIKLLYNTHIAMLSTFMLAVCSWFIFQSAVGWDVVNTLFFFLIGIYLFLVSLNSNKPYLAIIGGILFAAGLYTGKMQLIYFFGVMFVIVCSIVLFKNIRNRQEIYYFIGTTFVLSIFSLWFYGYQYDLVGTLNGHYGADTDISLSLVWDKFIRI